MAESYAAVSANACFASRQRVARHKRAVGAFHLFDQIRVISDPRHDRHVFKVLRRRTHHRRAPNVDVLDQVAEGDTGLSGSLFKRIEIHHHHVDGLDAVLSHRRFVLGIAADIKQTAVHTWVQRLYAAVEHLWKAGELADVLD